jgi:hypothetical protein
MWWDTAIEVADLDAAAEDAVPADTPPSIRG